MGLSDLPNIYHIDTLDQREMIVDKFRIAHLCKCAIFCILHKNITHSYSEYYIPKYHIFMMLTNSG